MSMTDPIADMLTRVRNANSAYKTQRRRCRLPRSSSSSPASSRTRATSSTIAVIEASPQDQLEITLKYGARKERTITGLRRISKPGLRVYAKKDELPRVLGGLGIAVISTSQGVMTDRDARKAGVGGEVVAYVW